ncbi:5'-nucleotidase C-terminal domain-containing protein [Halorussus limi]|uniref:5'-nucleotidase C-terminal domain-containing protein n=1 Tax=Halorussus limi TaxID=2938695 RepID=A0A8U0HTQ8_9EURY|nr:5'-nucleotidase C-terminal domain-containing protein [Halorussus limi]UPV74239.1 5'-nucleotidase C-terminal domain-containing protein [Halorussus limi]
MRLLHYSDVENVYDRPERAGRLAGCIDARRDGETVVVGTGDDLGPGVLPMVEDGAQALDLFEALDPEVETFGNHDFDYGLDAARRVVRESPQTWVSANVSEDGDPFAADAGVVPRTVVERGGRRVGFVGVSDPESSIPDALTVTDPASAIRAGVADLRAEGVERVVALAHVHDERLTDLARAADLDAILAGHVHGERCDRIDGTLVVRPGANGRVVWEVELGEEVRATRREVQRFPCAERVAERLRTRMAETGLSAVVGRAEDPIERDRRACFAGERRVSNLLADAYRWAGDADVGYYDTGMLRSGPPLSGDVTVADVMGLAPFAADLCVARVSGAALRELAEATVVTDERAARIPGDAAWWGQFSGMSVVWDPGADVVREVRVGGDPLDPDGEYAVATNEYVVDTDEFPGVTRADVTEVVSVQYDALVEYAREFGVEAGIDGRIVVEEW